MSLRLPVVMLFGADWGKDDGVDNHARVSQINAALQARGLKTWFDEEQVTSYSLECVTVP